MALSRYGGRAKARRAGSHEGTAEFLICKRRGVYIGAIGETASGTRAVININSLDDGTAFSQQPDPVDHGGEPTGDRLARRATNCTCVSLRNSR